MILAYVDESGDSGYVNSPAGSFTLGIVLVDDKQWLETLDSLVELRRAIKQQFGLKLRDEIKANYLIHGKGPIRDLGLPQVTRLQIYAQMMDFIATAATLSAFAVVIRKNGVTNASVDARSWAWTFAIQRFERYAASMGANLMVFPDEGHGYFIRKKIREMRRFSRVPSAFGAERLSREATNIVEDPSDRQSHESYMIQLADLCAYAAYRSIFPTESFDGSMWNRHGTARVADVSKVRGGPAVGIVAWP